MRKLLVAGNWKMNGSLQSARQLLSGIAGMKTDVELAVFPPYVHLHLCATSLANTNIHFGAQDVSAFSDGAYTGDVSASMLKDIGCYYVIIGHSERRQYFHETNAIIEEKCRQAFSVGLVPILCVGETLRERDQQLTLSIVKEQLAVVARLKDNCVNFGDIVIAYEPVWAIGTGKSATPEDAQGVHAFIRAELQTIDASLAQATRILYGGSVKPDNAKSLFAMPDIDGALVGGASLNAESFLGISER